MYPITPQRGNEPSAQGSALGIEVVPPSPCKGKSIASYYGFCPFTQGVALGYLRAGLSGRLSDTCG